MSSTFSKGSDDDDDDEVDVDVEDDGVVAVAEVASSSSAETAAFSGDDVCRGSATARSNQVERAALLLLSNADCCCCCDGRILFPVVSAAGAKAVTVTAVTPTAHTRKEAVDSLLMVALSYVTLLYLFCAQEDDDSNKIRFALVSFSLALSHWG